MNEKAVFGTITQKENAMNDLLRRINELYHKSKTVGLTPAEKNEQAALRAEYVRGIRKSVINQLNNITIEEPDGSFNVLADKGIEE